MHSPMFPQVSSYRNGERVMMTQDYLERLDTHTALSAFDFSSFTVDDVTRLPPHFNSKPITILRSEQHSYVLLKLRNAVVVDFP